jgi:hypothetical protein
MFVPSTLLVLALLASQAAALPVHGIESEKRDLIPRNTLELVRRTPVSVYSKSDVQIHDLTPLKASDSESSTRSSAYHADNEGSRSTASTNPTPSNSSGQSSQNNNSGGSGSQPSQQTSSTAASHQQWGSSDTLSSGRNRDGAVNRMMGSTTDSSGQSSYHTPGSTPAQSSNHTPGSTSDQSSYHTPGSNSGQSPPSSPTTDYGSNARSRFPGGYGRSTPDSSNNGHSS